MSNGSEHTPERGEHAVDGPDWAGLRELNNAEVDAVDEAWDTRERFLADAGFPEQTDYHRGVSYTAFRAGWKARDAEVEALLAENEKHRADLHEWETVGAPAWVAAKDAQIAEVWAERDALQARLDAMRVEERWQRIALNARGRIIPGRLVKEQRLVGPWTVVPEGDAGKLTSRGLEKRPDADFDVATHRPLAPEGDANA